MRWSGMPARLTFAVTFTRTAVELIVLTTAVCNAVGSCVPRIVVMLRLIELTAASVSTDVFAADRSGW